MKKTLIAFSTVGLLLSSVATGSALAAGNETVTEETEQNQEEQEQLHLTLDTVINRALEDDSNLLILSYQLDLVGSNERIIGNDLDDIEDTIDDARDFRVPGTRAPLYDSRDSLLDALEQLPLQERQLILQQESTIEGVKLLITSRYVQLLALEEQLNLSKQSMDWLQEDLRVLQLQYQVGLASWADIQDLEREVENLERTIEDNQANYERELLKLLVDLNIPYSEDITLADIEEEVEVELPEKPENVVELIENTYQMQAAKENVELAELTLEQQWYNGLMTRKANQVAVEEAKINMENLQKDLTNTINTLYNDTESLYLSYQDALRNLANLEEDQARLHLQYQVGLVSKYDYEKMVRSFKQTELELELTEKNYFTMLTQIDALQRGFIQ